MTIKKQTHAAAAIVLMTTSVILGINKVQAEECASPCTVTDDFPEIILDDTDAADQSWEIEGFNNVFGISPNVTADNQEHFRIESGSIPSQLVLDSTGNIGIKTASPDTDIEIEDSRPEIRFDDSSAGGQQMDIGVNQTFMHIEGDNSQDIVHIDANAPANSLFIQPSGDVGIGTDSPDFALHVRRSDGTAQIKITEDELSTAVKTLFSLVCESCTPGFRFANNALSQVWFFRMLQSGNFSVDDPGTAVKEAEFRSGGDVVIGGTLTQGSSRDIKRNIIPVDSMAILEKVEQLDIARWTYQHNQDNVVHMGPMAEDFYQAFQLGGSDKGISSVDTAGVALASIQALNQKLLLKDQEINALRAEMDAIRAQLSKMSD